MASLDDAEEGEPMLPPPPHPLVKTESKGKNKGSEFAVGKPVPPPVAMGKPVPPPVAMGKPVPPPVAMGKPVSPSPGASTDASNNKKIHNNNKTEDDKEAPTTAPPRPKIEPLEISGPDGLDIDDEEGDDMESLLPSAGRGSGSGDTEDDTSVLHALQGPTEHYCRGCIKAQPIGNMKILFPEYYRQSGWGVLGPHGFGPCCVFLILLVATHYCLRKAHRIGPGSVVLCYVFFAVSSYLLMDVSLRDPGICLRKEIPEDVPAQEARHWRWCDSCGVFQPPGGAHCPECNVCVAGYDHHCVWMGTCIGKRNYRQFIRFNVSWLYYVGYLLFWLSILGPSLLGKK